MSKSLEKSKSFDKLNSININTKILNTDTLFYNNSVSNIVLGLKIGDNLSVMSILHIKLMN